MLDENDFADNIAILFILGLVSSSGSCCLFLWPVLFNQEYGFLTSPELSSDKCTCQIENWLNSVDSQFTKNPNTKTFGKNVNQIPYPKWTHYALYLLLQNWLRSIDILQIRTFFQYNARHRHSVQPAFQISFLSLNVQGNIVSSVLPVLHYLWWYCDRNGTSNPFAGPCPSMKCNAIGVGI